MYVVGTYFGFHVFLWKYTHTLEYTTQLLRYHIHVECINAFYVCVIEVTLWFHMIHIKELCVYTLCASYECNSWYPVATIGIHKEVFLTYYSSLTFYAFNEHWINNKRLQQSLQPGMCKCILCILWILHNHW